MRGMTDRDAIFIRYPVITKNYIPKIPGRILTSFHLFQLLILSKFKIAAWKSKQDLITFKYLYSSCFLEKCPEKISIPNIIWKRQKIH